MSNLAADGSKERVREVFSEVGAARSINITSDIFTDRCGGRGGRVAMAGHEALAAIARLNDKLLGGESLRVRFEKPRKKVRSHC